ncbi:MAG: hypothetical protein JW854_11600 [Actinobacteria bacterium]|nr:hypothetical protein [Actinomycetota bacterium]
MRGLTRWQKNATAAFGFIFLALAVLQPLMFQTSSAVAAVNASGEEASMLQLINQARNSAGLPSLYAEEQLTDLARSYSSEMIQYDFFGHVSPVTGTLQQRITARGITGWTLAGENIAKAPSVEVAFDALMNSPSHKENILRSEFNCIGIGVLKDGNCLYITQEFMCFSPIPASAERGVSPAPAPAPQQSPDTFESYLLIMNPNEQAAQVTVTFQGEDGSNQSFSYDVGANSRFTVPVRETVGCGSFSTDVESDIPVLAERAMYFRYEGRMGGHDSIGAIQPSTTWFFAEGYTGDSFDTWVLLQNPNDVEAAVTLSFMRPDGGVITHQVNIPPRRRHSVHVDEVPGLESTDVSTQVASNVPIVAERAMYFNYGGKDGGHDSIGASSASNTWFFAEGYTGDTFDTWVLLQNPNEGTATVSLSFMKPDGSVVSQQVSIPGRRRQSVHVDSVPGLEATDVSTRIDSDLPIIAERSMYFSYQGRKGGHATMGAASPESQWYLAEGYTGGEFDEYVLLLNPGDEAASVDVVFMRSDGVNVNRKIEMGPHSRFTIHVDEVGNLADAEVSTKVTSSTPIVVELAQYFNFRGLADGNNAIGSCQPSTDWYFAEGCVK